MATRSENLSTALDQLAARIVEVTASVNPDYSVGNRSISKGAYLLQLQQAFKEMQSMAQNASGSYEVKTRGMV